MRTCHVCTVERPESQFDWGLDSTSHFGICKPCCKVIAAAKANPKGERHGATYRTCYCCERRLENSAFQWRSNGKPFSACKECNKFVLSARSRARKKAIKSK